MLLVLGKNHKKYFFTMTKKKRLSEGYYGKVDLQAPGALNTENMVCNNISSERKIIKLFIFIIEYIIEFSFYNCDYCYGLFKEATILLSKMVQYDFSRLKLTKPLYRIMPNKRTPLISEC